MLVPIRKAGLCWCCVMNRSEVVNQLYDYFNIYHTTVNNKTYKKLFTKTRDPVGVLINDKVYVSGVNHAYICNAELVLRDRYAFTQVNVKYRDITDLKVYEQYGED